MKKFLKSIVAVSILSSIVIPTLQAAKYEVVYDERSTNHKYTYAKAINDQGDLLVASTSSYNLPLQYSYLTDTDFANISLYASSNYLLSDYLVNIEDYDALVAGNPTANDLAWATTYIKSQTASSSLYQKFLDTTISINQLGTLSDVTIFDQKFSDNNLTLSTIDYGNGLTNDGWIFGNASAPYLPQSFTNSSGTVQTYWIREFSNRGFITTDNGNSVHSITSTVSRFGGDSAILGMNDNLQGVGYQSTAISESNLSIIDNESGGCTDPDIIKDLPYDVCVWRNSSSLYHYTATMWQFDSAGNVVSSTELGQLVTPNVDDTRVYKSYALAINNSGVAVGFADGWVANDVTEPVVNQSKNRYAVIYKNGEVIDITPDHTQEFDSRLYDINDDGIAVGSVNKYVNGNQRSKFFYIDTNSETLTKVFPDDFFTGSSSTARAINNKGFIVGDGEVETKNDQQSSYGSSNPRRRHAFLYSINDDTFVDLNDYLTCSSPYTIIEARDINENNEIAATALISVPRRDAKGEILIDENGDQMMEDVPRAIKLKPTAGEIEDCSSTEEKVTRKGAGFGWFTILIGLTIGFRKRKLTFQQ